MKKHRLLSVLLITALVILTGTWGVKTILAPNDAAPVVNKMAPDFDLPNLEGKQVNLKKTMAQNKVTLVNFWATWCPPCRGEIPELIDFNRKYSKQKVTVLAVNLQEEPKEVAAFAKEVGLNFPVLTDQTGKVGNLYQVYAIPTTFIIDRKGIIRFKIEGGTNLKTLAAKVEVLLKEK